VYFFFISDLLWDITQGTAVIPYGRYGKNYRSHLQATRNQFAVDFNSLSVAVIYSTLSQELRPDVLILNQHNDLTATTNTYDCLHLHEIHVRHNYPYMFPVTPKRLHKHYDTKSLGNVPRAHYSVPLFALII
jgi:hypothetical protein